MSPGLQESLTEKSVQALLRLRLLERGLDRPLPVRDSLECPRKLHGQVARSGM